MKEPRQEETAPQEENQEETQPGEIAALEPPPEETTEMEDKPQPAEEAPPGEAPEELKEEEPTEPQLETQSRRFLRSSIRWGAGLLIVFFVGVLAAALFFYRPANQSLAQARQELQAANQRIDQLEGAISDLEAQLEDQNEELASLEQDNQALQQELEQARTRIIILRSLSNVNAARLALENDDQASAMALLSNTPETLSELVELVSPGQVDMVNTMQDRLDLVDLENILFANP